MLGNAQRAQRVERDERPRPRRPATAPGAAAWPAGTPGSGAVGSTGEAAASSRGGGSASTAASSSGVADERVHHRAGAAHAAAAPSCALARRTPTIGASGTSRRPQLRGDAADRRRARRDRRRADREQLAEERAPGAQLCLGADVDHAALRRAPRSDRPAPGVERRCAMSSVVRPAVSARRVSWMAASVAVSTADVASSSTSTRGSVSTALASATRCRCPPESVSPRSPTTRVVALGQASTNVVHLRRRGRGQHLRVGGVGAAVGDVGRGWCRRTGTPPRTPRPARGAGRPAAATAAAPRRGAARPPAGRRSAAAAARPSTCPSPAARPARAVSPGATARLTPSSTGSRRE